MSTWRLTVEYDGRAFSGFQRQLGARTVQQELEETLARVLGGERVIIHGSGRTDAGVHALGQVVSFKADTTRSADQIRLAMNTLLPPDLAVVAASPAPDGFHARMTALGKTYRYLVLARPDRSPFYVGRAWYLRKPVDWARVDEVLAMYRGVHDFSAFRAAACTMPRTVRNIRRAERTTEGPIQAIEFEGPGFLRYQVRILVGTAIEVGMGKRTIEQVEDALRGGPRELAGRTAPPDGLYLVAVRYPGDDEANEGASDED